MRLYLNTPTWITGLQIQQFGVKELRISYQESRRQWKGNTQEIVSKIFSTADWEEIPRKVTDNGIILPEGITEPLLFKFVPLLTDFIIIQIKQSHNSNDEAFVNELELHSDCKLSSSLVAMLVIIMFNILDHLQPPEYLTNRGGRSLITSDDGIADTIPAEVFSQFKVEVIQEAAGGVSFRNMKGEFLSENLDWSTTASKKLFRVEKHGGFQAFRSLRGEYLSLKDDGSLEILPEGETIEKGKLIDSFTSWGPFYKISFDLWIISFGPALWSSVLSFKGNEAANDWGQHGDRVPSILLHSAGQVYFVTSLSGNGNYNFPSKVELDKWHKIDIEQKPFDGKVTYIKISS